ncbi:hypothetical protein CON84_22355 [Bacillus sp. AFS094228]|nr:hypothetical protein CON84_22355 [Bacillus sp. AFS094228]
MYLSLIDVPAAPSTPQVWFLITKLIGAGARLLREKRVQGRPCRCKPRRLPGPPAESEAWNGNKRPNGQTTKKL